MQRVSLYRGRSGVNSKVARQIHGEGRDASISRPWRGNTQVAPSFGMEGPALSGPEEFHAGQRVAALRRVCYVTPMRITIDYPAMFKVEAPPAGSVMEVPDGCTAGGLLDQVKVSKVHQRVVVIFVNQARVHPSVALKDGDVVHLAIPFGGG
jgi:sulfur carrier protein ThiS